MSDDDLNNIEKFINKKIKLFLYLCLVTYLSYLAVYCSLDYLKFKEKVNNNLNKYVEKLLSHIDEQILIYRSVLSNTKASLSALKIEQNDKYHSAVSSILHLQTQILRQFSTNNQAMLVLKIIKCNSDYTETSVYGVLHSDYKPICEVLNGKNTAQFVYKLISDQSVNGNVLLYICTKVGNEQSKLGYACIINSVDDIAESKTQEDGSQVSIIDSKEEEIEKDFIGIRRLLYSTDNNIGIQIKIASKNYYNTLVLRILAHFKLSMIVLTILLMSLSMLYILIITKVKKVDRYIKMGRTAEQEMRLLRKFLKSRNIELLQDIKATIQLLTASNIEDKLVILPSYRKKLLRKIELAASGLLTKDYVSTRVNVSVTAIFNRNIKILAKSIFLRNITIKQNASAKDIVCADPLLLQQVILSVLHYVINNLQKGGQLIISVSKVFSDNKNCRFAPEIIAAFSG